MANYGIEDTLTINLTLLSLSQERDGTLVVIQAFDLPHHLQNVHQLSFEKFASIFATPFSPEISGWRRERDEVLPLHPSACIAFHQFFYIV